MVLTCALFINVGFPVVPLGILGKQQMRPKTDPKKLKNGSIFSYNNLTQEISKMSSKTHNFNMNESTV